MNHKLLSLLQLSDPALPIGGYAHSAGLETYVQLKLINNIKQASDFVVQMLSSSLHYSDAYLASLAYDAVEASNWTELRQLDNTCTAIKLPAETRQASKKMGVRLLKNFQPLCVHAMIDKYITEIHSRNLHGHYCIAFGLLAAVMDIDKEAALTGFYYNAAAGMVTNAVKLVPLGQQQGQALLFSLQRLITDLVTDALSPDIKMIGLVCPAFEIRAMQHEALYSRLFMS